MPSSEMLGSGTILVHEVIDVPAVEKLLRSGDSQYSEAQLGPLMQHMREEHSSPEEIGRVAAAAKVGEVVLTHLVPGGSLLPDSAYSDGVRKFYAGPVVVAQDLMEFR